jgi:hypothetical protein
MIELAGLLFSALCAVTFGGCVCVSWEVMK